ncbi:MAG: glycosyltransferase family 4 protein [Chloroflexi bacterium]|nr:glycosyltransferase family 4 protein [Chloroflexota bacterium]
MHICFVMPAMYPALAGLGKPVGGSEMLTWHLAQALLGRGHRISVLTGDYGQAERQVLQGIEVFRLHDGPSPIKGGRMVRSIVHLWRVLRIVRPDVVVHMNFGFYHGVLALLSSIMGLRYVYFTASAADVDGTRCRHYPRYVASCWRLGLRLCSAVVVQTEEHRALLEKNFGKESTVIPNGIDVQQFRRVRQHGGDILWVANWRSVKRPDTVGELARRLPECRFVMCGGISDRELYERVHPTLPANVSVRGYTDFAELVQAYQNASMLINTSDFEGIPLTFDEAWACELPVVSLNVDPDGVIAHYGLGYVSRSVEQMVEDIATLHNDPGRVREIGARCLRFVTEHHNVERTVLRIEELFLESVNDPRLSVLDLGRGS